MIKPELEQDEEALLGDTLQSLLSDLRMEIADTYNLVFRANTKQH